MVIGDKHETGASEAPHGDETMSDEPTKTERALKTSGGETPDLKAVIDGRDPGDVNVFGYQVIYTTGDFQLPREDLLNKMADVGLPEWMAPSRVAPHRCFGRMIDDLEEELAQRDKIGGHRIRFDLETGASSYEYHISAKVWHGDEETGSNAGKWQPHDLGVIQYEGGDVKDIEFLDRIEQDFAVLGDLWYEAIKTRARSLFEGHRDLHIGDDVNNMVYYLCRQWTDAIKLRDSCYFVPAAYEDIETYIDGFRELYQWIDENYKTSGQTTELFAIEIMDSERQRQMVEAKVVDELEDEVGNLYGDIVERVREGTDLSETAEMLVDDLMDIESTAERHSKILETQMSLERARAEALDDLDSDEQEVVEKVLDEAGLSPREEVAA